MEMEEDIIKNEDKLLNFANLDIKARPATRKIN